MDYLQLTIPARESTRLVRIRPREVHTWLDNLPYMDPARTAGLLSHQLRLMNRQAMTPAARLAILCQFLAAYHRLSESAPGTSPGAQRVQPLLKRLCQDLGFGYKIVVHELAGTRARLLEARSLSAALLGALHVLGQQLLHYYRNYQRVPRALWRECLTLYRYARKTGRHTFSARLPGAGKVEIDAAFRLIALLRLSNPYRLPQGMAAALERYLRLHIQLGVVESGGPTQQGQPHIALGIGDRNSDNGDDTALAINVRELLEQLRRDVGVLKRSPHTRAVGLPDSVPAGALLRTLEQLLRDWESAPGRTNEREAVQAKVELVAGIEAVYCVLNGGRCFEPRLFPDQGAGGVIDLGQRPLPERGSTPEAPTISLCRTLNRSRGGVALRQCGEAASHPQVGGLIAVRRTSSPPGRGWVLAVCRWQAENEGTSGFDFGLQYLTREARAVAIRCADGSGGSCQPALTANQRRGRQAVVTLIARSGGVLPGQQVSVYDRGGRYRLRCVELMESGTGFERFLCLLA